MLKHLTFAFFLLALPLALPGQVLLETFDAALNTNGFSTSGEFEFAQDGTGANVLGWNNRSRIRSASEGGAALFRGPGEAGRLLSGTFDATGTELYLTFYHYLKTAGGSVQVQVFDGGGIPVFTTTIVPDLPQGGETSAGKFEIIDISAVLNQPQPYQLEFSVIGGVEFWLLDDITVTYDRPDYPTFPRYVGEQLTSFGRPFVTDSLGAAAVPYELVIDFTPSATMADKEMIRQQIGAIRKETCVCDRLEVWELPGGTFFDPATGQPLGDPGIILEGVLGSNSNGTVDNVELNLLSYHELQNVPAPVNAPLTADQIASLPPAPDGAVRIAVLDTGLDLDHPDLAGYVFRNDDGLGNNTDDDNNCYEDDAVGWNFVDGNNNPSDNHSHGTHVAGIIAQNLAQCQNCPFQIIPYKTHDSYGVGTLFAVSCGTYQAAINDGAAVINASWGFYGGGSDILRAAVDTAGNYGALVVAAAGNDSLNLVADFQYPATLTLPEVISVGAVINPVAAPDRAAFSNYNPGFVDLFAPGTDILSAVPDNDTAEKTGTSMSTPAVAAAVALHVCDEGQNPPVTKNFLLVNAEKKPVELGEFVADGNMLDLSLLCDDSADEDGEVLGGDYSACLQEGILNVKALRNTFQAHIEVYFENGGMVADLPGVSLSTGESIDVDLTAQPVGSYLLVIRRGERVLVQRLVKR